MSRTLRHALVAAAVLGAAALPLLHARYAGRRDSEALRARMAAGTAWDEVARQLDARPLLVQWVSFRDASGRDCGSAYIGEGGVQGEFTSPKEPDEKEATKIPLKSHLDPLVAAVAHRCPRLRVHSTAKLGFSRFSFEIALGPDGKIVSTEETRVWD